MEIRLEQWMELQWRVHLFRRKVLGRLDMGLENTQAVGKDVGLPRTTRANLEGQNEKENIV